MGSKQLGSKFLKRSEICSHTPSALNAGAMRSGATCHMAMPQCCYLAKGAKRPSHTTNTMKFDRIPFDPFNSIKRFDLCPFDQKNSTYFQPPIFVQQRLVSISEGLIWWAIELEWGFDCNCRCLWGEYEYGTVCLWGCCVNCAPIRT